MDQSDQFSASSADRLGVCVSCDCCWSRSGGRKKKPLLQRHFENPSGPNPLQVFPKTVKPSICRGPITFVHSSTLAGSTCGLSNSLRQFWIKVMISFRKTSIKKKKKLSTRGRQEEGVRPPLPCESCWCAEQRGRTFFFSPANFARQAKKYIRPRRPSTFNFSQVAAAGEPLARTLARF